VSAAWPWWEQYDEVADALEAKAREGGYTVTFWEHPDHTGFQLHVYTWAADSPEQAVEFAWRQVEQIAPKAVLHSGDATAVGVPERSMLFRAADDIRTLTDGLKAADQPTSPEAVLAMLPRDAPYRKHLQEALNAAREEEAAK
jgi:hypothetical protein